MKPTLRICADSMDAGDADTLLFPAPRGGGAQHDQWLRMARMGKVRPDASPFADDAGACDEIIGAIESSLDHMQQRLDALRSEFDDDSDPPTAA